MKLINRSLVISILFVMTGVGVTFAAGTNGTQNFLLGGTAGLTNEDINQVLTLLVGPAGADGADGVDGADGADGTSVSTVLLSVGDQNCPDGGVSVASARGAAYICNGRQGVDGATGRDGASVTTALLNVGDQNCPTGGVSVTSTSGTSYICNGKQGAAGANGANGTNGTNGTNGKDGTGGGGGGFGMGALSAGTCDESVTVQLKNSFSGGIFSLKQVLVTNMKAACGAGTAELSVIFTVRNSGVLYGEGATTSPAKYISGDEITCLKSISGVNWIANGDTSQFSIEDSDVVCKVGSGPAFSLNNISGRDITGGVGFTIG